MQAMTRQINSSGMAGGIEGLSVSAVTEAYLEEIARAEEN